MFKKKIKKKYRNFRDRKSVSIVNVIIRRIDILRGNFVITKQVKQRVSLNPQLIRTIVVL